MILTWKEILKEVKNNKIKIENFDESNVTSNSYDLRLWTKILKYKSDLLDTRKENEYEIIEIPAEWYLLAQWEFVLSSSAEKIGSDFYTPLIHNKSWVARLWLFVHITADLIDLWFYWNTTFQLFATLPVKIYPNMKIAQVTFWETKGDIETYNWFYKDSVWPIASKIHLEK